MSPGLKLLGAVLILLAVFAGIFLGVRAFLANQESTQIRKYVTNSASILEDSANVGNEEVRGTLRSAGGDPARLDAAALENAASQSRDLYRRALANDEVPPRFEDAHHYLASALGMRAAATERLTAAAGEPEGFGEALSASVEDYRVSDALVSDYYLAASRSALENSGHLESDERFLYGGRPFMDYEDLGFGASSPEDGAGEIDSAENGASAPRDVQLAAVEVSGQPLYPGGNVALPGSAEPVFAVTVYNAGEVAADEVSVEVVLNGTERRARTASVGRIAPGTYAVVEVRGFGSGRVGEVARVGVEVGSVEREEPAEDDILQGTVTFGV